MRMNQYDVGTVLEFYIKTEEDKPFDLTDCTVYMVLEKPDKSQILRTLEITDAEKGFCRYVIQDGDLSLPGTYKIQVIVSGQSFVIYTDVQQIKVNESLAKLQS